MANLTWKQLKEQIEALPVELQNQPAQVWVGDYTMDEDEPDHREVKELSNDGTGALAIELD